MKFKLDGYTFDAENCIDGILFNPKLPKNFDNINNENRPDSHQKWWYRPFIVTGSVEDLDKFHANRTDDYATQSRTDWVEGRKQWLKVHPTGIQYVVRCLDGGAWDRSTNHGSYADVGAAIEKANYLNRHCNHEKL